MSNGDKLIEELPRVRVTRELLDELMREAALQDRSLSDLVRLILQGWVFGHRRTVAPPSDS